MQNGFSPRPVIVVGAVTFEVGRTDPRWERQVCYDRLVRAFAAALCAVLFVSFPVSAEPTGELFQTGLLSLLFAMIAISIYIWVRFEWQFGVGGLFALFHDVSLTLGMFALTQLEFDLNIVAAILTIIGYSLNDTIVIYDRIRENLKKFRKMPLPELLDLSVNETLHRTVMTSLTILVALLSLLLLGPRVIFGFSAALILGIFVATYSSVYAAAPMLVWLKVGSHSFVPAESATDRQERVARGGPAEVEG